MQQKPLQSKRLVFLIAGLVVMLALGGWWWWQSSAASKPTKPSDFAAESNPAVVAPNAVGSEVGGMDELSRNGVVDAVDVVPVVASADGIIDAIAVQEGAEIFAEQLLTQIRNGLADRELKEMEAEFNKTNSRIADLENSIAQAKVEAIRSDNEARMAQSNYERTQKAFQRQELLNKEGATPRKTYEQAQREYEVALTENEARRSLAKVAAERQAQLQIELDRNRTLSSSLTADADSIRNTGDQGAIRAPVAGILIKRSVKAGEQVRSGQEMFRIATGLTRMQVLVTIGPEEAARVKMGDAALVVIPEVQPDPVGGVIESIAPTQLKVVFQNPSPTLKPGTTAQVKLKLR
jgi:HlyD family secretion protein